MNFRKVQLKGIVSLIIVSTPKTLYIIFTSEDFRKKCQINISEHAASWTSIAVIQMIDQRNQLHGQTTTQEARAPTWDRDKYD